MSSRAGEDTCLHLACEDACSREMEVVHFSCQNKIVQSSSFAMQAESISRMKKQSFLLKVPRKRESLLGGLSERFTWAVGNRFRSISGLNGIETWVPIFYLGKVNV